MWFQKKKPAPTSTGGNDQCVIAHLPLSDREFGEEDERDEIHRMTDKLDAAIRAAAAGEFDGDEFGGGECKLYMYGPSADKLFEIAVPILRQSGRLKGGHVIVRYGPPGARAERIEFP